MPTVSGNHLLSVHELALPFANKSESRSISFQLDPGNVVWIKGPSGIGKTTLLRILARLTASIRGEVFLNGISWKDISAVEWRKQVVYLHQKPVMFGGTVLDNLKKAFLLRCRVSEKLDLRLAGELVSRLLLDEHTLDKDARVISVGEGARVALIRSLLTNPCILLIDEVTSALDPVSRERVVFLLKEWFSAGTRGIIGVSHDEQLTGLLPGKEISLS